MKAKDYFLRVAQAEKEIRVLRARVAHYEDLGLSITAHITNTPISSKKGSSRVESSAVGIVDGLNAIQGKLGAYESIVRGAEILIEKIPQERYRRLLTLHYLCGWKLPKVGQELGYEDRNSVYRAHGWALCEAQKLMKEDDG